MPREILLRVPKEEEDYQKSRFSFVLSSKILDVGGNTVAEITSRVGSMPTSFRKEIGTKLTLPDNILETQKLIEELSEGVLKRYPEGHRAHDEAAKFIGEVHSALHILD